MGAAGPVILGDGGVDREMRRVEEFSRVVEMVIGDVREKQCGGFGRSRIGGSGVTCQRDARRRSDAIDKVMADGGGLPASVLSGEELRPVEIQVDLPVDEGDFGSCELV